MVTLLAGLNIHVGDVVGSLFTDDTTSWNVAHLESTLSRLLPSSGKGLPGVNTPYLYFGMWRATFAVAGKGSQQSVRWERITATNEDQAPSPRGYHSMVVHGVSAIGLTYRVCAYFMQDHIYVHAGSSEGCGDSTLHAYNLKDNTWKTLASAPEPGRIGSALVATTIAGDTDVLLRYGGKPPSLPCAFAR